MATTLPVTTTLRDSVKVVCPPWLQGYWGYRLMYSLAIQLDGVAESLRQGLLARMPGYGTAEALPYIGNDRQIARGFQETDDSYIARLQTAFDTWKIAGSARSILIQLAGYVTPSLPLMRYVVNGVDEIGTGHTPAFVSGSSSIRAPSGRASCGTMGASTGTGPRGAARLRPRR